MHVTLISQKVVPLYTTETLKKIKGNIESQTLSMFFNMSKTKNKNMQAIISESISIHEESLKIINQELKERELVAPAQVLSKLFTKNSK